MKSNRILIIAMLCGFLGTLSVVTGAPEISIRAIGFRAETKDELRFYFEFSNRTKRHLFVSGDWHSNAKPFGDANTGFLIPPSSIAVCPSKTKIDSVNGSNERATLPTIECWHGALGHGRNFFVLLHGKDAVPGDTRPAGQREYVDILVNPGLLRKNAAEARGEYTLALVFELTVYALDEQGSNFTAFAEVGTPAVRLHFDAAGQVKVIDPEGPSKRPYKSESIREMMGN